MLPQWRIDAFPALLTLANAFGIRSGMSLPASAHPLYFLCIILHLAGCQVEASRRAYKAAQSPKESEALKKQADDHGPTRRRPASLKVGVEDAAPTGAGHTKRAHRSSATKAGTRLRPIPSSSVQVEQHASQL